MTIVKHSVSISGHSTSISIEERFWQCLRAIAEREDLPLARLIARIDAGRASRHQSFFGHPAFRSGGCARPPRCQCAERGPVRNPGGS